MRQNPRGILRPLFKEHHDHVTQQSHKPLTREQVVQVNAICTRFERAWQLGQAPTIEAIAAGADSMIRSSLIQHLAEIDIHCRVARGNDVDLEVYLGRWPDLDRNLLEAALESAQRTGATSLFQRAESYVTPNAANLKSSVCDAAELLNRLRNSRLLAETDLAPIEQSLTEGATSTAIGARLIEARKLTSYQFTCLLEGSGDPLVLGEYVVQDLIGRGGMGAVYRAVHRRMKRTVAIKVLRRDIPHADLLAKRFLREVEVAARLCHPNIVTAYDAGESHGISYLVSEYVEGQNLGDLVKQYGPLSLPLAVDIVNQAAKALEYAHGEGVIHRDIKPSNLLLDDAGNVKLLDVGLARVNQPELSDSEDASDLTTTGMIMGTVDYMSPEQAQNTRLADERSDIYSLGCTLYFLITGRAPYPRGTGIERLLAHREQPIPSLCALSSSVPESFDRVLQQLMAKKPAERTASMTDVANLLDDLKADGIPDLTLPLLSLNELPETGAALASGRLADVALPKTQMEHASDTSHPDELNSMNAPTLLTPAFADSVTSDIGNVVDEKEERTAVPRGSASTATRVSTSQRASTSPASLLPWVLIPGLIAVGVVIYMNRGGENGATTPGDGQSASSTSVGSLTIEDLADVDESFAAAYRDRWAAATQVETEQVASGIVFMFVPPGRFAFGEVGNETERTIDGPFWISEVEVTVGQFRAFVEDSSGYQTVAERDGTGWGMHNGQWVQQAPYCWKNLGENFVNDDIPACSIAYPDAAAFCDWASKTSGRVIRLPTEEEWEYACRCGRRGSWCFGDDAGRLGDFAWYSGNSGIELKPVRSKLPNAWSLFDMHGNESEWCLEPSAATGDYSGNGILRGGGFASPPDQTRTAARVSNPLMSPTQGAFRVVMEQSP